MTVSKSLANNKPRTFLGTPKLPAKYATVVMPFFLSILMSCIVSGISTFNGVGASPQFIELWLGAWLISWIVAFPTLLMVLPLVRKLTAAFVELP
ncbi:MULTISPECIES: DUF2798 domain-containing protein [Shewanella]|jgi:hypothetical protein|uniref:DUF2798 domain-containing protein n=2 Tax=Shewanella putrefaciens TaxID=24 RepID=E6XQJ7_SHEP2|nr:MULTISPECIES: DUF2798 domain-containing protein [Shewanella]CAD6364115.1 hypothetical protein SHEWT2_01939 [Shewanella hafniensis]ABM24435.1 conserved hypothetical protein [Shewanella sp. W3-18-1]MCK7629696.1 DUF2798 domain-containing protein [Shewanella sp. JNE9-1]MCK7644856.1 DUF2798 domain-containing protein [Shewanella sp. JNE3-1]MCK7652999.1 DUF2798 domain-containing protein [Shewanella sp. JNE4-1]